MSSRLPYLLEKANSLPFTPGVYIMRDRSGKIIYVGKSRKLKARVSQYFQNSRKNIKTQKMVDSVYDFDYILCSTEIEALSLENTLIKQHTPRYNIKLKDAKSYPYIKITAGEFPRLSVTRTRSADKAKYFGPYSGTATAYGALNTIEKILGLPTCKRSFPRDFGKERPCIYYQMGRCCGLCTGNVSKKEYASLIRAAAEILRGNTAQVRRELEAEMYRHADAERYEAAARCRDTVNALNALSERQHVVGAPGTEADIVGFYSDDLCSAVSFLYVRDGALSDSQAFAFGSDEITEHADLASLICRHYRSREYIPGEVCLSFPLEDAELSLVCEYLTGLAGRKVNVHIPQRGDMKALCSVADGNAAEKAKQHLESFKKDEKSLLRLSELLRLEVYPERIEAYDISNIGSEYLTAGMIVCVNGKFSKKDYRTFRIKSVDGTDDYASMREALTRRFTHRDGENGSFPDKPDLVLLDGGKGHVSVIRGLFSEMGIDIPVFGMVKDEHHKTRALTTDTDEINIAREQAVFTFIYRIQEEVHRFTVSRMENAKRKTLKHSSLEAIKGIGQTKAKALLTHFGGLAGVKAAEISELSSVKGISAADAAEIYRHFHKN